MNPNTKFKKERRQGVQITPGVFDDALKSFSDDDKSSTSESSASMKPIQLVPKSPGVKSSGSEDNSPSRSPLISNKPLPLLPQKTPPLPPDPSLKPKLRRLSKPQNKSGEIQQSSEHPKAQDEPNSSPRVSRIEPELELPSPNDSNAIQSSEEPMRKISPEESSARKSPPEERRIQSPSREGSKTTSSSTSKDGAPKRTRVNTNNHEPRSRGRQRAIKNWPAMNGASPDDRFILWRLRDGDPTLNELNLSSNWTNQLISNIDVSDLLTIIRTNESLTKLNLTKLNIGEEGAFALSSCLRENNVLRDVDVSYNKITEEGLNEILNSLSVNTTLDTLSLEGNPSPSNSFSDSLAQYLGTNTSLTSLNIQNMNLPITFKWFDHLIHNSSLMNLKCSVGNDNDFKEDGPFVTIAETNKFLYKTMQNTDMTHLEVGNFLLTYHFNEVCRMLRNRHVTAVYTICNTGVDLKSYPTLVQISIENRDLTNLRILLSTGIEVDPEWINLALKHDSTENLVLVNTLRAFKENAATNLLDLSDGGLRWMLDCIPKSTASISLARNHMTTIDMTLINRLASLPKLTSLDLSKNEITSLPNDIYLLTNIRVLNLSDNKLDTLPVTISEMKNLRQFEFRGNPIANLPEEITKRGIPKMLNYLREMQAPTKPWSRVKLMVVGQENVGKTHLINCLKKKEYPKNISTDGIEKEQVRMKRVQFLIYDFGGQEVFYPTHQFFLNDRAIYIVVFNLADPPSGRAEYWLKKIRGISRKSHPPPVIVVGTHLDDPACIPVVIDRMQALMKKWKASYPNIQGHCFVSCLTLQNLKELRTMLITVAQKQKILNTLVPQLYLNMDKIVSVEKTKKQVLTWEEYTELGTRVHISDRRALESMTEFLHDVGTLIWFDQPGLRDIVILDDQWLASVMATIVSFKTNWKDGVLPLRTLDIIWKNYPQSLHKTLLGILINFEVVFPFTADESKLVVPSLLPATVDPGYSKFLATQFHQINDYDVIERLYTFEFMPVGFFSRFVARMFQVPEIVCHNAYRQGFLISPAIRELTSTGGQFAVKRPSQETSFERRKSDVIEYALQQGYQQGLVYFDDRVDGTSLRIVVVKPKKEVKKSENLLLHTVMIVENFLRDSYARYEESVIRTCTFKSGDLVLEYPHTDLVNRLQAGDPFIVIDQNEESDSDETSLSVATPRGNEFSNKRVISISQLAPDISFENIPLIPNEKIVITEMLGKGGCGIVYKGIMENTEVAVKELHVEGSVDKAAINFKEFQHEVYMMSGLQSPYLVQLLGIQLSPLRMVLEFVPGRDLSEILHDTKISDEALDWSLRRKIALDIAMGMAYLHHHVSPPIIHRDLRSPNCFVVSLDINNDVHCKVADFGLAQRLYVTLSERLFTWQWLAPEILDEKSLSYDHRVDIYSYGVVLWEIATRAFPYDEMEQFKVKREEKLTPQQLEDSALVRDMTAAGWNINLNTGEAVHIDYNKYEIIEQILEEQLRPTIPESTPKDIASCIRKCWSKDPDQRPSFMSICTDMLSATSLDFNIKIPTTNATSTTTAANTTTNTPSSIETSNPSSSATESTPKQFAPTTNASSNVSPRPPATTQNGGAVSPRSPNITPRRSTSTSRLNHTINTGRNAITSVQSNERKVTRSKSQHAISNLISPRKPAREMFEKEEDQSAVPTVIHKPLASLNVKVTSMEYIDEHVWIGCCDGRIYIFDVENGQQVKILSAHKRAVRCISSVSPKLIYSGGADSLIYVYSRKKKAKTNRTWSGLRGHSGIVLSILPVEPDEDKKVKVWSGDSEGNILLWKGESRIRRINIPNQPIYSLITTMYGGPINLNYSNNTTTFFSLSASTPSAGIAGISATSSSSPILPSMTVTIPPPPPPPPSNSATTSPSPPLRSPPAPPGSLVSSSSSNSVPTSTPASPTLPSNPSPSTLPAHPTLQRNLSSGLNPNIINSNASASLSSTNNQLSSSASTSSLPSSLSTSASSTPNSVTIQCNPVIWAGSSNFTHIYSMNGQLIKKVKSSLGLIWDMLLVTKDQVWVGSDKGPISIFDPENLSIVKEITGEGSRSISMVKVSSVSNQIWMGDANGAIHIFDIQSQSLLKTINDVHQTGVCALVKIDSSDQIWSASDDGTLVRWYFEKN
eukprot:TRINITY_DN1493_c0_g1_i5.p2 TRINITY_DN1493_c0_g1~~TRINITY_DN1493_c0_g1_i5.p2  ORF type:complete len:2132 (-),score=469.27 TRINITY_DN1493_c0_g1_i5:6801-13196(-)